MGWDGVEYQDQRTGLWRRAAVGCWLVAVAFSKQDWD